MNFVLEKQLSKFFVYLSAPFILQNFHQKDLRVDSELWGCATFLGPKQPICPEQRFFGINHCYYFELPIGYFHCAKFKRNLTMDSQL